VSRPVAHGTVCANLIVGEVSNNRGTNINYYFLHCRFHQANDFCGVGVAFSARAAIFPFIANAARVVTEIEVAEALALGFSVRYSPMQVQNAKYFFDRCRQILTARLNAGSPGVATLKRGE
jgi:hypothetical protein